MSSFYGVFPGHGPGACPIDGAPFCTCKNPEQPDPIHVIDSNSFAELRQSNVRATEDIYVPSGNGLPGSMMLLYKTGDVIREEDLDMLGLTTAPSRAALAVPQDKARRGPREIGKASRDKELTAKED